MSDKPLKTCTRCEVVKEHHCFYTQKSSADGLDSYCRKCRGELKTWRHRRKIRRCVRCKQTRTWLEFRMPDPGFPWRRICKECEAKDGEYMQGEGRKQRLHKVYKMTVEDYDAMLVAQNGRCAICDVLPTDKRNDSKERLTIDHDHTCCPRNDKTCGRCVRWLLCMRCNKMLGFADDKLDILLAAVLRLADRKGEGHEAFKGCRKALGDRNVAQE